MNDYLTFTQKSNRILKKLITPVLVSSESNTTDTGFKELIGLWDTGATSSSINAQVAIAMSLSPIGAKTVCTANGTIFVPIYSIDIQLPNKILLRNVKVTGTNLGDDIDMLIGMDIISQGNLDITNTDNSTTLTFQIPSVKETTFS